MADITKMFVHYAGTKEAFAATSGYETKYANSIVFIAGGESGKSCIYTHGRYFANAQELVSNLKDTLEYVKGVKVGDKTYTIPAGGGYVPFAVNDPNTVELNVSNGTLTFGLSDTFVGKVNSTAASLGTANDEAGTGTAWAYIKYLEELIGELEGKDSSLDETIEAINKKDASQDASISALDASMQVAFAKDADQDASISALDASMKAAFNKDASLDASIVAINKKDASQDASIAALDGSMQAAFAKNNDQDTSIAGLATAVENINKKDASQDDRLTAIEGKLDASIATAMTQDGNNHGVAVSVTTQKGIVTGVTVDASGVVTHDELAQVKDTKDGEDAGIKVTVATEGGKVTSVAVDASALESALDTAFAGKADLDDAGKIVASQLPDYILGQVLYGGTIDATGKITASTNFTNKYGSVATLPAISADAKYEGAYFIATAAGTAQGVSYNTGDWVISTGSAWVIVDNTDAVSSVAGLAGAVTASALAEKLASTGDDFELALKSELTGANEAIDASLQALDASVQGLDASVKAAFTKNANQDSSIAALDGSMQAAFAKNADQDSSIAGLAAKDQAHDTSIAALDASMKAAFEKDASQDGRLSAIEGKLDASVAEAVTEDGSNHGVAVSVTTQKGKVTGVTVDASGVVTHDELNAIKDTKDNTNGGIKVTVSTEAGKVTSVAVDASALTAEIAGIKDDASTLKGRVDAIEKKDASQDASINNIITMLTWEEL